MRIQWAAPIVSSLIMLIDLHQYPLVIQLFDLFVAHVQQGFEDIFGIRAQQGRGAVNVARRLRHFEWNTWIELLAHHRVIVFLHEAARLYMLVFDELAGAQYRACRHPCGLQAMHDLVMVKLGRPRADKLVQRFTILDTRRVSGIKRILRQRGLSNGRSQRRKLLIVFYGYGAPLVFAAARVDVVWREETRRVPVAQLDIPIDGG